MDVILEFDGACEPVNPGGTGTFGYVIRGLPGPGPGTIAVGGAVGSGAGMTNNVAEYTALLRGLEVLGAVAALGAADTLVVRGDSQLVVRQIEGAWRCNHEHLTRLRDECRRKLDAVGCPWRIEWVPREQNADADAQTAAAYERETGRAFPVRDKKGRR